MSSSRQRCVLERGIRLMPLFNFATFYLIACNLLAQPLPQQLGDLDADGRITVIDLQKLLNHFNGSQPSTPRLSTQLLPFADVNEDGYLNQDDVARLRDAILGTPIPVNTRPVALEPATGSSEVGVTVRPKAIFPKPIDIATLNSNNFYATFAGRRLAATITPANNGTFAWLFFHEPMPNASQVQVTVDGSTLRTRTGLPLDADGDGALGGVMRFNFSTVSIAGVPNTILTSRLVDPGPDLIPRTSDDVVLAAGYQYLLPIGGVKVHVIGQEQNFAYTDANGRFTLTNMPVGNVKVVLDGRTATNPPAGYYFPEMVMDTTFEPGITNGVMNIVDANGNVVRDPNGVPIRALAMYLPRVASNVLQTVSASVTNLITLQSNAAYTLPPAQQQYLTVEIMPGSLIGMDGQPLATGQVGISVVPPELVREMLPPGLLQHTFDITVQAPGIATFATPAPMTFPNVFHAPPGTKLNFLSFDHTTGRLVVEGTCTVSEDGLFVRTDPGTGVTHPGWHGMPPPGSFKGPPPPPPPPECKNLDQSEEALCLAAASAKWFATTFDLSMKYAIALKGCRDAYLICFGVGIILPPVQAACAASEGICVVAVSVWYGNKFYDAQVGYVADLKRCQIRCPPAPNSQLGRGRLAAAVAPSTLPPITDPIASQIFIKLNQITEDLNDVTLSDSQRSERRHELLREIDSAAGGDGVTYLRQAAIRIQQNQGFDGTEEQPQQKSNPVLYVANVLRTNGEIFQIRGKTTGSGQYSVFIGASDIVANISFYDPISTEVGDAIPYLNPNARYALPHPTWFKLDATAVDTDGDKLEDFIEEVYGTSKSNADTDNDGLSDWSEVQQGLDPLSGRGFPTGVIASLPLPGAANEIVLEGSLTNSAQQTAYLALRTAGLGIVDASRFQMPIFVGQLPLAGDALDVAVDSSSSIAVVAGTAGLHFVTVTNSALPSWLFTIPGSFSQVEVANGIAYAAAGDGLRAYDVLSGQQIDTLALGGAVITGLAREGSIFFTMDLSQRLRIVDISGGNMVARGALLMPGGAGKLFVGNGIAYVAAEASLGFNGGFSTADVSSPDLPTPISGVDAINVAGHAIAANGSGLVLTVGRPGGIFGTPAMDVMSAADSANTGAFLTRFNLSGSPSSIAIGAGIAFVANGVAGLQVVNYRSFDNQGIPPTITVSGPVDRDSVAAGIQIEAGSVVTVTAQVADDVQVRNVELLLNGQVVVNDVSFPWDLSARVPRLDEGGDIATIQVRATDTGGNTVVSPAVTLLLVPDLTPPRVIRVQPLRGSILGALNQVGAYFSEPLALDSFSAATLSVRHAGDDGLMGSGDDWFVEGGTLSYRDELNGLLLSFPTNLAPGAYQAVVNPPVTDLAGNPIPVPYVWQLWVAGGRDTDRDGIPDDIEPVLGLDPNNPSSFGDGVIDGDRDLDGDRLQNRWEIQFGYDPKNPDSNNDTFGDGNEDPDGDGLVNLQEQSNLTHPLLADSDGDLWDDRLEISEQSNPLDPRSIPKAFVVANPPVALVLPAVGGVGATAFGSVVANPPVSLVLPAVGSAGSERLGIFIAQPPVQLQISPQ